MGNSLTNGDSSMSADTAVNFMPSRSNNDILYLDEDASINCSLMGYFLSRLINVVVAILSIFL